MAAADAAQERFPPPSVPSSRPIAAPLLWVSVLGPYWLYCWINCQSLIVCCSGCDGPSLPLPQIYEDAGWKVSRTRGRSLAVFAWWMIPEGTAGGSFLHDISAIRIPTYLLRLQMGSAGEHPHLLVSKPEDEWMTFITPPTPPSTCSETGLTSVIRSINTSKTPPRPCTLKDHSSTHPSVEINTTLVTALLKEHLCINNNVLNIRLAVCLAASKGQFGRFQESKNEKSYLRLNNEWLATLAIQLIISSGFQQIFSSCHSAVAGCSRVSEDGRTSLMMKWCWDVNHSGWKSPFDRIDAGQLCTVTHTSFLWLWSSRRTLIFHVVYSIYGFTEQQDTPSSPFGTATMIWRLQVIIFLPNVAN